MPIPSVLTATKDDAETGTSDSVAMTPLRVAQAIEANSIIDGKVAKTDDTMSGSLGLKSLVANGSGSPFPKVQNSVTATGTFTANSKTFTVASGASLIKVGDAVSAPDLVAGSYVEIVTPTGGGAATIVMSRPTTANGGGSRSVTFGMDRWSDAHVTGDTVAGKNGFFGQAAQGHSTMLTQVGAIGFDHPTVSTLVSLSPSGHPAATFGTRMSDNAPGLNYLLTEFIFTHVDSNPTKQASMTRYMQATLMPGTSPLGGGTGAGHTGEESSIASFWPAVETKPFSFNAEGSTRHYRMDSGIGPEGGNGHVPGTIYARSNPISCFIDWVPNGSTAYSGIVVGQGALETSGGRMAPVIAMPYGVGFAWFKDDDARSWEVYASAQTGGGILEFASDSMRVNGAKTTLTGAHNSPSRTVEYQTGASARFTAGLTNTGETTGNAGSDYAVARFSDAGAFLGLSLLIRRADGLATFESRPQHGSDRLAIEGGAWTTQTPTPTWTGGTPTGAILAVRWELQGKKLFWRCSLYTGSALNGASALSFPLPANLSGTGDEQYIAGLDANVLGHVGFSVNGTSVDFKTASGLTPGRFVRANGVIEIS